MSHRFAIIDPSAGLSGDMLLGALVSAIGEATWLRDIPARLGLDGVTISVEPAVRAGITAQKVTVLLPDGSHEGPGDIGHRSGAPQPHHHGHGHRHVPELVRSIEQADLAPPVRARAIACFERLAGAEGRVHGTEASRVALHEVGALDALVDVVGVISGFAHLELLDAVFHWPPAIGNGWVRAAHGTMPVPAPATALLLEGMAVRTDGPATGEATTPTGAALLATLSRGAPPDGWRLIEAGHFGAGERNPEGYANVVRLLIGEQAHEAGEIVVLATDVDDLNPEFLEPVREALLASGAVDVQTWATMGKKGRISFRIEAVAPAAALEAVADALFRHSSTGGVRVWPASRFTLKRSMDTIEAEDGSTVRIKTLHAPDGPRQKLELDDLQALAHRTQKPVARVARELHEQAARRSAAAGGCESPNSESGEQR